MNITRRDTMKLAALGAVAAAFPFPSAAQANRVRLPLHEFVLDDRLMGCLRKGVKAMKARMPSDPLSWFFQASIHGVTDQLWTEAAKDDPGVLSVDRAKYWNQCPHKGENSANFLPWHRGYTHHFEEILRMHTEEDDFAIPYWDYSIESQRTFPKAFGIRHLDGNKDNDAPDNINPLYHDERDSFLCDYEYPLSDQLPLTELSVRAVDTSRVMACPVFFGTTESNAVGGGIIDTDGTTRGLLEQSPHDQIHRAVGGSVSGIDGDGNPTSVVGGMAYPPTAGFDPIFPIHHSNIDRLWVVWASMPGKQWGNMPSDAWFDEKPWYFFDTSGKEVNRSRRDYFDHRALGVRFKDEDLTVEPLPLPAPSGVVVMAAGAPLALQQRSAANVIVAMEIDAPVTEPTKLPLSTVNEAAGADNKTFNRMSLGAHAERVALTLKGLNISQTDNWGFDVFVVQRDDAGTLPDKTSPQYLGTISIFNHQGNPAAPIDQRFDITDALSALSASDIAGLDVVLVPYELVTSRDKASRPQPTETRLKGSGLVVSREASGLAIETMPHQHK
ncbi:tyrosinase family protein [Rhizobium mongolense]|uniref:tyrosinase family protein n=1 Tax=Rhizobium mongolense TaxID=57676 RepID=UPI0034A58C7D